MLAVDRLMDLGGLPREHLRGDARKVGRRAAGHVVPRKPRRHHRRCGRRPLRPRAQELLADKNNEAVLVLNVPTALASAADAAAAVAETVKTAGQPERGP